MFGRPLFGSLVDAQSLTAGAVLGVWVLAPRWQDVVLPGCAIAELHEDLALTAEYSGLRREEAWRI